MAPRKKKHPALKIHDEEILPHRRSSLQVNLSYVSNLSDSGNGSLRVTQLENDVPTEEKISARRNALPRIAKNSNSRLEEAALCTMNDRVLALNQSCEILKNAIINKTREIFDGRAELVVKTATVLKGQRQALKEINDDSKKVGTNRKIISNNLTNKFSSNNSIANIQEPRCRHILRSSSRLSDSNKSPILSGSNRSHGKTGKETKNKVLRVRLTRLADPRLELSMESSQSSLSDIGAPIICSSFLGEHGDNVSQLAEKDCRVNIVNSDIEDSERNVEASSLTPMEITAIKRSLYSSRSKNFPRRSEITFDNRSSVEAIPMEFTTVQSHLPPDDSSAISEKTNNTSLNVNTSVSVSSSTSETRNFTIANRENDNSPTDETAQISLRVNTSLETEKGETNNEGDRDSAFVDKDTERSSNAKKSMIISSDSDSNEEMSLIARLRNISSKKGNRANRLSVGEGPSFIEGTPYPPSRSILWKTQIRSETIKPIRNLTALKRNGLSIGEKNSSINAITDSESTNEECMTALKNTIILGDSPLRISCNTTNPRIIEDSSGGEEPSKTIYTRVSITNKSTTSNGPKTGKKKLLPLNDNYELVSFSPISPPEPPPKIPITWKPRKKFRKRKTIRAIAEHRIEASRRENEDDDDDDDHDNEPSCSKIRNTKKLKAKKPRKVISKKIVIKKIVGQDMLQKHEGIGQTRAKQLTNCERSSTNEFSQKKRIPIVGRNLKPQKLAIVATGFSKGDVDLIKTVVKELGGAEISSTVSRRTTHVVSTGVRTINLLRGIIRGCWMVSLDWVLKSLEKKKWLDAENYEMIHFSKAVQENRRDRQIFGRAYVPELFTTCGPIYIEHGTSPPPNILKELVKTAGGRITEDSRDARLIVGSGGLREIWVLDSITTGDLQPIDEYRRKC